MRIVSLLPSATEIVCSLGLGEHLVGVTHECDYPPFVRSLPKATRTLIPHDARSQDIDALVRERHKTDRALYTLDLPVLERLAPDLLVTQALCDVCAVAEAEVSAAACSLPGQPRVVNLEPMTLADVFECVRLVGEAADVPQQASRVVAGLQARVDAVAERTQSIADHPPGILLEWIDPPFGCGHWSPELVRLAGGRDALGNDGQSSRTSTWERLRELDPSWLMVACCGFDVARTLQDMPLLAGLPGYNAMTCVRRDQVFVTDGNAYFSRPGPRLVDSLEILAHALHPAIHPPSANWRPAATWRHADSLL